MASARDTSALVVLLRRGRRSPQAYAELVEEAGSAVSVLERDELQRSLFDLDPDLDATVSEIEAWEARGIQLVGVLDPRYPRNLLAVHDRPPLLFVAGSLAPEDTRSIAVIGSRRASAEGIAAAKEIAEHLVEHGYSVISGLAAGIDTSAHRAALARVCCIPIRPRTPSSRS